MHSHCEDCAIRKRITMEEEIGKTAGASGKRSAPKAIVAHTTEGAPSSNGPSVGWRAKTRLWFRPRRALSESARKGDGRFTRFDCFPWGKKAKAC